MLHQPEYKGFQYIDGLCTVSVNVKKLYQLQQVTHYSTIRSWHGLVQCQSIVTHGTSCTIQVITCNVGQFDWQKAGLEGFFLATIKENHQLFCKARVYGIWWLLYAQLQRIWFERSTRSIGTAFYSARDSSGELQLARELPNYRQCLEE